VAPSYDACREILHEDAVVAFERLGEPFYVGDGFVDRGIMVDPRGGDEHLHRIGDSIALAVSEHREPRPAEGRASQDFVDGRKQMGAEDLLVDLREHVATRRCAPSRTLPPRLKPRAVSSRRTI